MKIGLSYSRCLVDIYDGNVKIEDVLVIVSRTDFDPMNDEQWIQIWNGYYSAWYKYRDKEDEFRALTTNLHKNGKLHQPRQYGAYPLHADFYWLDAAPIDQEIIEHPAVQSAWENYVQTIALVR